MASCQYPVSEEGTACLGLYCFAGGGLVLRCRALPLAELSRPAVHLSVRSVIFRKYIGLFAGQTGATSGRRSARSCHPLARSARKLLPVVRGCASPCSAIRSHSERPHPPTLACANILHKIIKQNDIFDLPLNSFVCLCRPLTTGNRQSATDNWPLTTGHWPLATHINFSQTFPHLFHPFGRLKFPFGQIATRLQQFIVKFKQMLFCLQNYFNQIRYSAQNQIIVQVAQIRNKKVVQNVLTN